MADDRNSGMNIPVPFKQIIGKYSVSTSDWSWGDNDIIADYHVSIRDNYSELPATVEIVLDFGWWQDPDYTTVWYNKLIVDWEPISVWHDHGGGGEVELGSVALADLNANNEYYWKKGVGLFVYSAAGDPATERDISVVINGDWLKDIYSLTDFGINSEELVNSPNMEIEPGYYAFCETISQSKTAIFRTSALYSTIRALIRYSLGQSGFHYSFIRHSQTIPWQYMKFEKEFYRKYLQPAIEPKFSLELYNSKDTVLGDDEWTKNANIICNARIRDLESVKYGGYGDFLTEVWDPRNRGFAFGLEYPIEYIGAVGGTFASDSHIWHACLIKLAGKVQDWKEAHSTNDNGSNFSDITSDMNLKNNSDVDFDDTTNDWVVLGSDDKFFALTLKYHSAVTIGSRSITIEYLSGTGPYAWTAFADKFYKYSDPDNTDQTSHYNSTDYYQMKTNGDFHVFEFYTAAWVKKTFEGTSAYWIRIKPSVAGDTVKLSWVINSGTVFANKDFSGTLHRNDEATAWSTESILWTPINMKMIDEKRQLWGCFYDIGNKKYHPFAIQFVEADIDDVGKRSWGIERVRVFNGDTLDFSKKFASFDYGSDSYVYAVQVDDNNPDGNSKLVRFSADIENDDEFEIVQDLIGGDGNIAGSIKTNYANVVFPNSESSGEREYGICGITSPNKCVAWEYANIRNNYINVHNSIDKNLKDIVRDIVAINNSAFFMDHDGQLIFKSKDLTGVSAIDYTLSNYADYGEGNIKSLDNFSLYNNIINKIKVSWDSGLFGSGSIDVGTGLGIGKQITLSNNLIDNRIKAIDVANDVFKNYSYVREYIRLEIMMLFFLELSDILSIKIEHPKIYIDSTKEWVIDELVFNPDNLIAKIGLIERLIE